jgi:hypothetical protein
LTCAEISNNSVSLNRCKFILLGLSPDAQDNEIYDYDTARLFGDVPTYNATLMYDEIFSPDGIMQFQIENFFNFFISTMFWLAFIPFYHRLSPIFVDNGQVLVLPTYYKQLLFVRKCFRALLCLQFVFVIFGQRNFAKSYPSYVGEIDCRCQFHQHFMRAFFMQNFCAKNYKAASSAFVQNFGAKNALWYKKTSA